MSTLLVSEMITKARAILNDGVADNFAQDDISDLCNGSTTAFRAYNQNITTTPAGPAAPQVRINNIAAAVSSFDPATGIITCTAAPAVGSLTYLEYFFNLMTDAEYLAFCQQGVTFLGNVPLFTAVGDNTLLNGPAAEAVIHYMAHLGASKMTNLSSWYYRFNAGNKSIDKAVIAQAFKDTAVQELVRATAVRDGQYTREGRRNAPASRRGHTPFPNYTPPR